MGGWDGDIINLDNSLVSHKEFVFQGSAGFVVGVAGQADAGGGEADAKGDGEAVKLSNQPGDGFQNTGHLIGNAVLPVEQQDEFIVAGGKAQAGLVIVHGPLHDIPDGEIHHLDLGFAAA